MGAQQQRDLAARRVEDPGELDGDVAAADDRHPTGAAVRSKKPSEVIPSSAPGTFGTNGRLPVETTMWSAV